MKIHTHKTALKRKTASRPMRDLVAGDYIQRGMQVLDYGCGYGEDLRFLERQQRRSGVVLGYDPHEPFGWNALPATKLDVVTMIYVINVIPREEDRWRAIREAWSLVAAGGFLFLAARTLTDVRASARRYNWRMHVDGFVTSRRTFQRGYWEQDLRSTVANVNLQDVAEVASIPSTPYSNLLVAKRRWA